MLTTRFRSRSPCLRVPLPYFTDYSPLSLLFWGKEEEEEEEERLKHSLFFSSLFSLFLSLSLCFSLFLSLSTYIPRYIHTLDLGIGRLASLQHTPTDRPPARPPPVVVICCLLLLLLRVRRESGPAVSSDLQKVGRPLLQNPRALHTLATRDARLLIPGISLVGEIFSFDKQRERQ